MTHLAGLRDERKAVVLVTEGWLLYQPNPKLSDEVRKRMGGPATPAAFEPPVKPPSDRGSFTSSLERECEADFNALAAVNSDLHFRTITEDANRGNVTFYPVYARGLASFDAPIGPDYPPPIAEDMTNLRTRHNTLRTLAVETDGDAIIDTNYIEKGLKRIADDLSSYYLFGYYSTNAKLDGRYRTITVRVKQPGVRVRARRGYPHSGAGLCGCRGVQRGSRLGGRYTRAELGCRSQRAIDVPCAPDGLDAHSRRHDRRSRVGGW
jgi:VWFA-related protein